MSIFSPTLWDTYSCGLLFPQTHKCILSFMRTILSMVLLNSWALESYSERPLFNLCYIGHCMFSYSSVGVSGFTFKSLIYLESAFVQRDRYRSDFIFCMGTSFSPHHLLKMIFLPPLTYVFGIFVKQYMEEIIAFVGFSLTLFHWSTCLFGASIILFLLLWLKTLLAFNDSTEKSAIILNFFKHVNCIFSLAAIYVVGIFFSNLLYLVSSVLFVSVQACLSFFEKDFFFL